MNRRHLGHIALLLAVLIWALAVPAIAQPEPCWTPIAPGLAAVDTEDFGVLDSDDFFETTTVMVTGDPVWPRFALGPTVVPAPPAALVRFDVERPSESRAPPASF